MKTEFELERVDAAFRGITGTISIIGKAPDSKPYIVIHIPNNHYHYVQDKDLERFAVNILKALKSKHLK